MAKEFRAFIDWVVFISNKEENISLYIFLWFPDAVLTKNWKQRHAILKSSGNLLLYKKITDPKPKTVIKLSFNCERIEVGDGVADIKLPGDRNDADALFAVITNRKAYVFLAPSTDECRYT